MMSPSDSMLSAQLTDLVRAELASGESIVWAGQPIPSRFSRIALPQAQVGIVCAAGALCIEAGVCEFKIPDFSRPDELLWPLLFTPFILAGFGFVSLPYWMRRFARRIAYVVTDRRAFTVSIRPWRVAVRSFAPDILANLRRYDYPDGSGDLIFDPQCSLAVEGNTLISYFGFASIPNVKDVENLIREVVRKAPIQNG